MFVRFLTYNSDCSKEILNPEKRLTHRMMGKFSAILIFVNVTTDYSFFSTDDEVYSQDTEVYSQASDNGQEASKVSSVIF